MRTATCQFTLGHNIPLLNAMAHVIVAEHLVDRAFVENRVADYDAFARFVADWPPERVVDICGVEADAIRSAARLYASTRPAMIVNGLGMTEHVQGTDTVSAMINLALLTGNIGKPGAGVNALRGQNNVQGAAHMGCEPSLLPGSMRLETARADFERLWQSSIPERRGLHQLEMLTSCRRRNAEGDVGDRVRRAPQQPECPRDREVVRRHGFRRDSGSVHDGDRARVRFGVLARMLVVRERRHVHERRTADSACAASAFRRWEARSPTGGSSASLLARWGTPRDSDSWAPRTSGTRSAPVVRAREA